MCKIIKKMIILILPVALAISMRDFKVNYSSIINPYCNQSVQVGIVGRSINSAMTSGTGMTASKKKIKIKSKLNCDIDGIRSGTYITKTARIDGKIYSSRPIMFVNVYIDEKRIRTIKVKPSETGSMKYNFNYALNPSTVSINPLVQRYGKHTVKFEAVTQNETKLEKKYNVEFGKREAIITQTGIKDGAELKNQNIIVSGMFLSPESNEKITVTLDGRIAEGLIQGIGNGRNSKKYADYDSRMRSNYKLKISKNSIQRGKHELKIDYYSGDKLVNSDKSEFTMTKPAYNLSLDDINFGKASYGQKAVLKGSIYHPSGIASVRTYIDGVEKGIVTFNSKSYSSEIDSSDWGLSKKEYEIKAVGTDGESFVKKGETGARGVTFSSMQNPLSYYVKYQLVKGINVGPFKFNTKSGEADIIRHIDPKNLMNDSQTKFVFMKLSYYDGISASSLNKILSGKGILSGTGESFIKAGRQHNINPIYLVSHALHETGNGSSKLANGISVSQVKYALNGKTTITPVKNTKTVYNMYGVGAFDSDALRYGSSTAFTGGDQLGQILSRSGKSAYEQALNGDFAWDTPEKAIIGGAKFISGGYVNNLNFEGVYRQDTLYKMKWDFKACDLNSSWAHQYATDVAWATKQTKRIKELVDMMGDINIQYEVPVFK